MAVLRLLLLPQPVSSAAISRLVLSQALPPLVLCQLDLFPAALLPLTALVLLVIPKVLVPLELRQVLPLVWAAALSALGLLSLPVLPLLLPLAHVPLALLHALVLRF